MKKEKYIKITLAMEQSFPGSGFEIFISLTSDICKFLGAKKEHRLVRDLLVNGMSYHRQLSEAVKENDTKTWLRFANKVIENTAFPDMVTTSPASWKLLDENGISSLKALGNEHVMVYAQRNLPIAEKLEKNRKNTQVIRSYIIDFNEKTVSMLNAIKGKETTDLSATQDSYSVQTSDHQDKDGEYAANITLPFTEIEEMNEADADRQWILAKQNSNGTCIGYRLNYWYPKRRKKKQTALAEKQIPCSKIDIKLGSHRTCSTGIFISAHLLGTGGTKDGSSWDEWYKGTVMLGQSLPGIQITDSCHAMVDLEKVPPGITSVEFTTTIYCAEARLLNMGFIHDMQVHVFSRNTGEEICTANIEVNAENNICSTDTAAVIAKIKKSRNGQWYFTVMPEGKRADEKALARLYVKEE